MATTHYEGTRIVHSGCDYDMVFKLLIIGDSAVGKSCLLMRYAQDIYPSDSYISGLGLDFQVQTVDMDGKHIKLHLWDTAGQERFRAITSSFYRGCHGVMLAFDITNMESFHNLPGWLNEIDKHGGPHVAKLLVGNKCDMKAKRQVPVDTAQAYADKLGLPYLETSAKTSTNVEQAYMAMTAEMKSKVDSGHFKLENETRTQLSSEKEVPDWYRNLPCFCR